MAWSFNPFTGNLDLVGSGGGGGSTVFEGEVATFADLPVTIGDPAVGAAYLVRDSTGVWLVNRRQAGIYIRRNNTGVAATDWEYGGDYPVNSVNNQTGNVVLGAADVGAAASSHTHTGAQVNVGTTANLPLKTGINGVIEAGSFGTAAGSFCEGNDARLSDARTPSSTLAHKASHAINGTDFLAPSDIGAQSIFVTEDLGTITANVTLTAARAKIYTVNTATSGLRMLLPTTGVMAGDVVIIEFNSSTGQTLTPMRGSISSGFFTDNLRATDRATFIAASTSATSWYEDRTISRFAAEAIFSGTVDVARLPVGTGSTQVAAGNHTHVVADITGAAASGSITSSGLTQATARILGRTSASTGAVEELAASDVRTFLNTDESTDTRDPNLHAASHAAGGSDPVFDQDLNTDSHPQFSSVTATEITATDAYLGAFEVAGVTPNRMTFSGDEGITFYGDTGSATRTNLGAAASGSITTSGLTQATGRILGRTTASTGSIEEIQIGSGLSLSAGELSATSSGGITAVGASTADVLSVSGSDLVADDGGTIDSADPFIKWNDSAGKLVYANPLSRPSGAMYVGLAPTTTALGSDAVNLQGSRSSATSVASGANSVAIGNNSRAGNGQAVAIGSVAAVTGNNGIAIGRDSGAGGNDSCALGRGASSSQASSMAIGFNATASGVNSSAVGTLATADLRAQFATLPFNAVYWGGSTTNATATILNLDTTATSRFTIAASTALAVDILLVARRSDTQDKWLVARRFLGIRRDGSNNTALIGSVQTLGTDQSAGSPTWTFTLSADDVNECLQCEVQGATGETVQWRATAFYRVV